MFNVCPLTQSRHDITACLILHLHHSLFEIVYLHGEHCVTRQLVQYEYVCVNKFNIQRKIYTCRCNVFDAFSLLNLHLLTANYHQGFRFVLSAVVIMEQCDYKFVYLILFYYYSSPTCISASRCLFLW